MNLPSPQQYSDWREWAGQLVQALSGSGRRPVFLPEYHSTNLPLISTGGLIYITDELAVAFSNGTDWVRVAEVP